jgi:hypothetical protein
MLPVVDVFFELEREGISVEGEDLTIVPPRQP